MIPVVGENQKGIGKVTVVEIVDGTYGQQIKVTLQPADPDATFMISRYFPYDTKKAMKATSKWVKFVKSFDAANRALNPGTNPLTDGEQLAGFYIMFEDVPHSGVIQGKQTEWQEPVVTRVFAGEQDMVDYWKSTQPEKVETAPVVDKEVDEVLKGILTSLWEGADKNPDAFWDAVKGWGYSREKVLAAVAA